MRPSFSVDGWANRVTPSEKVRPAQGQRITRRVFDIAGSTSGIVQLAVPGIWAAILGWIPVTYAI